MKSVRAHFLLLLSAASAAAAANAVLYEVHRSSWSGGQESQLDISCMRQASDVLQCVALAANSMRTDQLLVFIDRQGTAPAQCLLASRIGTVCRRMMAQSNEQSGSRIRVFVTSLDGCMISIQHRVDNTTTFYRNWTEYAAGFGDAGPHGNHWIGLRTMNSLTWPSGRPLRIRMRLWNDTEYWANYSSFKVDNEAGKFQLSVSGFVGSPGLGDCMITKCNSMMFSTFDSDNDMNSGSCSHLYDGGWWYNGCHDTNPNGLYLYPPRALSAPSDMYAKAIVWRYPFEYYYSMKEFEMLLL